MPYRVFFVTILALALAGCATASASTPAPPVDVVSLPCTIPYGTRVALVLPKPGSAAAAGSAIVIAATRELPRTVTAIAVDANGRTVRGLPLERVAPPRGGATPAFAHPVYYRSAGLRTETNHTYTVALDDVAQNGCAPLASLGGNASFST